MYRWLRELHLYAGLFLSPFILLFAVTTIMFNHTWIALAAGIVCCGFFVWGLGWWVGP